MKIWGEVPKVSAIYGGTKKLDKVAGTSEVSAKKDEFILSGPAKDFQTVMSALKNVPDMREGKVAEIGAKVDSGEYKVESKDISAKIIASMMAKRI